jgi:hypothetical protein
MHKIQALKDTRKYSMFILLILPKKQNIRIYVLINIYDVIVVKQHDTNKKWSKFEPFQDLLHFYGGRHIAIQPIADWPLETKQELNNKSDLSGVSEIVIAE